jgi:hypothetical protein
LLQDLEGEAVLLNLANGQYYGLDEASYHMYKTLISSGSVEMAFEVLSQEYEVDLRQFRADLDRFVVHLAENGLLLYPDNQSG